MGIPRRTRALLFALAVTTPALATAAAAAAPASAAELWVDGASAVCSDARTAVQASAPATPWCTVTRAAREAAAGDTVRVRAAVYRETVRPARSGTASAPLRFLAEPGAVLDAGGAANAIKLIGVDDVVFDGFEVRGGGTQGIWIDASSRIVLTHLDVTGNAGTGIQLKTSSGVRVEESTISGNGSAGILELAGASGARYTDNTITGNGRGGSAYNGDGIQLGGSGALVAGNTISGNGDDGPYEHGIYSAAGSSGWTIEDNEFTANGAANVKAAGGPGTVRGNRMRDGRYGIVLSDNPATVTVTDNDISGSAQHLVFLTSGTTAARALLQGNAIVQSGRSTDSGDASAVFVNTATALELRDNEISYTNPDALGVALWVNDAGRVGTLRSDANAFCATDARGRGLAWNGSRTTLAGWRTASGQDALSDVSAAPCG
jgi:parallel beta-helix repeat protein